MTTTPEDIVQLIERCERFLTDPACAANRVLVIARPAVEALVAAYRAPRHLLVPIEPSLGLLASMAMRADHGLFIPPQPGNRFGLPGSDEERAQRIAGTLRHMRQLHEEVVGVGFYRADKEESYAARVPEAARRDLALGVSADG